MKRAAKQETAAEGGINPKQPCPCGSGKRYKACHGINGGADAIVTRPFEGLAAEPELIAMREFVPSATAKLPLKDSSAREITLATVLPMAAAGLVRADGTAFVGLQVQTRSGDISRDIARSIQWALTAEPGAVLPIVGPDENSDGVRLQDLLVADAQLEVTVHTDFAWWMPEDAETTDEVNVSLERANAAILPTARLAGATAAYWVDARDRAHLRWVRPEQEEQLLGALAKLSVRNEIGLGEGTKYAGSFRAHGLLVPVWDLDPELHAKEYEQPAADLGKRLSAALAEVAKDGLNEAEHRALGGLRGRQITLR
ncbi:SEC-C domain-containing protein [Pseudonocardiaceae bacterium YIM PH 21723]|nr:SEC-C domain-containing protein [Pseudonocardiaceae bacterium YIM PH 21723]